MKRINEFKGYRSSVQFDPVSRRFVTVAAHDWPEIVRPSHKEAVVLLHRPRASKGKPKVMKRAIAAE